MHLVFVFGCPMEVCFNSAEYSNVVSIDISTCINPLTPIVVCVNSSRVLEGYTEGCGKVSGEDGREFVAPSGGVGD